MKKIKTYIRLTLLLMGFFTLLTACKKSDSPEGVPENEHHYFVAYTAKYNVEVTVKRYQTGIMKLPLAFYSEFIRDYDAVANYVINNVKGKKAAVLGEDFEIVNEAGERIQAEDGKYKIVFPKAQKAEAAIYVKFLNNSTPGLRTVEVKLVDNIQDQFRVDVFASAQSYKVTIE